jgi:hypothetical protein
VQSHGSLLFVGHHEDAQEKEEAAGSLWKIVYPEPSKNIFFLFIYHIKMQAAIWEWQQQLDKREKSK